MKTHPIKFFTIPPTAHMDLMEINDRYFFLAHLMNQEGYKEFALKKIKEDKHVIVDNGAAENKELKVEEIVDLAEELLPTEIVAPDRLLNCNTTLHLLEMFKRQFMSRSNATPEMKQVGILGVPQGNDPLSWMKCYMAMATDPFVTVIGMSKISIPASFRYLTQSLEVSVNRAFIVTTLLNLGLVVKPLHLLGMRDPTEYAAYDSPMIRSSDSCFAVLAAAQNCRISDANFDQSTPHEYFDYNLDQKALTLAKQNIEMLNQFGK